MAIVQNTREHDIDLNLTKVNGELVRITIPAAALPQDSEDNKLIPGQAEVDSETLTYARKNHEAVEAYFSEGWLKVSTKKDSKGDEGKAAAEAKAKADAEAAEVPAAPAIPSAPVVK